MRQMLLMLIAVGVAISLASASFAADAPGDKKKIVFIAGKASHGFGAHDHKAGWPRRSTAAGYRSMRS
jgi:hypothetical protein